MIKKAYRSTADFFEGKKTYIIAAILVLFGLIGVYKGEITAMNAARTILEGLGLATLRMSVGGSRAIDEADEGLDNSETKS